MRCLSVTVFLLVAFAINIICVGAALALTVDAGPVSVAVAGKAASIVPAIVVLMSLLANFVGSGSKVGRAIHWLALNFRIRE